jgi:hypothetical protein
VRNPRKTTRANLRQLLALARRALPCGRRLARIALLLVLMGGIGGSPGAARADSKQDSKQQMQSLDEQVQEIKSDALAIAAELDRLEEKLLYPSNTEVAVFVSLAEGESFRLDSVQIQIDGEPVAHHIYSWKELEALQKGGVQRVYTGNLRTGEHRLDVSVAGKQPGGADFSESESFSFSKDVGPKLVGITLAGGGSSIQLGGW